MQTSRRYRIVWQLLVSMLCLSTYVSGYCQHHPHASPMATLPQGPFRVESFGSAREMIHRQDHTAKVRLNDALSKGNVYAIGAVAGLKGEISVVNGKSFISIGTPTGQKPFVGSPSDVGATLLVSAVVTSWLEVDVEKDLDGNALRQFILDTARQHGLSTDQPFPYMIAGKLKNYSMHTLAGPNPKFAGHGSGERMARQFEQSGEVISGKVLGFYSAHSLSGVISHPGEFFHDHFVGDGHEFTAHLENFEVARGSHLLIPME